MQPRTARRPVARLPMVLVLGFLLTVACSGGCSADGPSTSPTGRAPASVAVSPAVDTLAPGATRQLLAVVRDVSGDPMVDAAVGWSSSDTAIATVAAGTVTARAAGTATITAASGSARGAATVVVVATDGGGGGGNVASCAAPGPGWLWCDDFEQNRLASYFEVNTANGGFARAAGVGRAGSMGMRARFAVGQVEAGNLKVALGRTPSSYFRPVDAGTTNHRELYWRVWVRTQDGWTGGAGAKLSRATVVARSDWSQAAFAHVWGGAQRTPLTTHLYVDPASGTTEAGVLQTVGYNDFEHMRWLGSDYSRTALFDDAYAGRWYCIEAHARLNDAGQANAVFEMWVDGALEASRSGFNWVGAYAEYGFNTVFLENYWNDGAPAAQERYFDDFVVSTQRIGCGS